ncbi:MAG: lysine biosynthesis protein LysX [Conexivisphaera sp.]
MASSIAILSDRLRWEEKALYTSALNMGLKASILDVKSHSLDISDASSVPAELRDSDVVLQRCVSHYRGLYYTAVLERFGLTVVNSFTTSLISGNKLLTSLELVKRGVPTPRTYVSFSDESALEFMDRHGYPIVLKPIVGSWGRMVAKLDDKDDANMVVEFRRMLQDPTYQVYYMQEYVRRPPRDLRAVVVGDEVVAAEYRYQPPDDWRTNVARGGRVEPARLSSAEREIVLKAAEAVGGGVLGVDAMETEEGLLVHEVNGGVEFHGAARATGVDIASKIIEYARKLARR